MLYCECEGEEQSGELIRPSLSLSDGGFSRSTFRPEVDGPNEYVPRYHETRGVCISLWIPGVRSQEGNSKEQPPRIHHSLNLLY